MASGFRGRSDPRGLAARPRHRPERGSGLVGGLLAESQSFSVE